MSYEPELSRDKRQYVEDMLQPGEKLCWMGRPLPGFVVVGLVHHIIFGCIWLFLAGGIFVEMICASHEFSLAQAVLFSPVIAVGVGLVLSPLWVYLQFRKTFYALTNRRAFIVYPSLFSGRKCLRYDVDDCLIQEEVIKKNGTGDLVFDRKEYRINHSACYRPIGFLNLRDVQDVRARIHRIVQENAGSPQEIEQTCQPNV